MDLRANVRPTPAVGQIKTRENPGLYLFPGILSKELHAVSELAFELVKSLTPAELAIAVDAENEYVSRPFVILNDLRQALSL